MCVVYAQVHIHVCLVWLDMVQWNLQEEVDMSVHVGGWYMRIMLNIYFIYCESFYDNLTFLANHGEMSTSCMNK